MAEQEKQVTLQCWIAVLGTMLGAFMAVLDIQITNSSLRDITGGIGATIDEGSWISTSYLIGEIVTIPLTAWLSRIFGVRWYLLGNVILFLGFSTLCGISHSLAAMIIFRAAQGFTGGVMIPMSLTVLLQYLPKSKQPVGFALFGMTATLAPAIGPTIGGYLTDSFGWPMVFYVNFIPGALMMAAILYAIEAEPINLGRFKNGDWWGIACMAIGLGSLIAMLEEGQRKDWFGSRFIQGCALLAAIFIPIFILIEWYRDEPFVNLRLLHYRNLWAGSVVTFGMGFALYSSVYLLPLYLQSVQGYNAYQTGLTLIWIGLPQLLIFPFVPILMKKFDLRLLVCFGILIFAASCFMNISMSPDYAGPQFFWPNIVRSLGQPFTIVPLSALATSMLSPRESADGSAIFNIARNIGGSVGIGLVSTIITRREQFHDFRIGESVTSYSVSTQNSISSISARFTTLGAGPEEAMKRAYAAIQHEIQKAANVMAVNDAFMLIGFCLLLGGAIVWICKKTEAKAATAH
ncbi:MAG TPA: DHA2 family efflux MFS transporter permease subunit [Chthoniobacterales bacterium]